MEVVRIVVHCDICGGHKVERVLVGARAEDSGNHSGIGEACRRAPVPATGRKEPTVGKGAICGSRSGTGYYEELVAVLFDGVVENTIEIGHRNAERSGERSKGREKQALLIVRIAIRKKSGLSSALSAAVSTASHVVRPVWKEKV